MPMPDLRMPFSPLQLGNAITSKRTKMKLRLVDVADTLGMSKTTLIKVKKGDTGVNFNTVLTVMEYLGLGFQILTDDPCVPMLSHTHQELDDDWT